MPAHDLNDGDSTVAFGGGPDPFYAAGRDVYGGRIARRDVVDNVIEIKNRLRLAMLVTETVFRFWLVDANPLIWLFRVVEPEVVIVGLGRQHGRQAFREWLQTVQGAVSTHADQAFYPKPFQAMGHQIEFLRFGWVHVIPRGPDHRAAFCRVHLRNLLVERIEMNMWDARVKEA